MSDQNLKGGKLYHSPSKPVKSPALGMCFHPVGRPLPSPRPHLSLFQENAGFRWRNCFEQLDLKVTKPQSWLKTSSLITSATVSPALCPVCLVIYKGREKLPSHEISRADQDMKSAGGSPFCRACRWVEVPPPLLPTVTLSGQ